MILCYPTWSFDVWEGLCYILGWEKANRVPWHYVLPPGPEDLGVRLDQFHTSLSRKLRPLRAYEP